MPTAPAPAVVTVAGEDERPSGFWKYQAQVRAFYMDLNVQWFIAALIILNFLVNVSEKEIDPSGLKYKSTWRILEHSFNGIFLAELLVNMYSCWCLPFWQSSWNVFDFVVVCVGCVSFFIELKGPLKLMRTLRAFRVFRLFKRIKSLNMIIVMIVSAVRAPAHPPRSHWLTWASRPAPCLARWLIHQSVRISVHPPPS